MENLENDIIEILRQYGWSEGLHIPVANNDNRELETKVDELLTKYTKARLEADNLKNSLSLLEDYHKSSQEQRLVNQELLLTFRKDLEYEEKLYEEVQLESDQVKRHIKDVIKKQKDTIAKNSKLQAELQKVDKECEHLAKNIEWSEELEQYWSDFIKKSGEDIEAIETYKLEDITKFKELERIRQKLVQEAEDYKKLLDSKLGDTKNAKCEIERTDKDIRRSRKERVWLMDQWQSAVVILRARDIEFRNIIQELNVLQEMNKNAENKTMEQKIFYLEQVRNNMMIQIEQSQLDRLISRQHLMNQKLENEVTKITDLVTDERAKLHSLGDKVSDERSRNTRLSKEVDELKKEGHSLSEHNEKIEIELKNMESRSMSVADRIKQLETIRQEEEKRLHWLHRRRKHVETNLQEVRCKIADARSEIELMESQVKQLLGVQSKLNKEILSQHAEIQRQIDLLANLDQTLEKITSEIGRIKGEKSKDDRADQQNELSTLKISLEEKSRTFEETNKMLEKCNKEIKTLDKIVAKYTNELSSLKSEKEHLLILIEGGEKCLSKLKEENAEKIVTENMLRLRTNRLEKLLSNENDKVYSLEKQKIELETALSERQLEIEAAAKVLKIRKKVMLEEIANLKKSIEHLSTRINQLMKRYEIIVHSVGKDDNGEPLTITNYKIKLVKERYILLEKGDDLDGKIRKAEKEIQAMENTLMVVNVSNNEYKNSVVKLDENSKEYQELMELEKQQTTLKSQIQAKNKVIKDSNNEIENLKRLLDELSQKERKLNECEKETKIELGQLEADVNEQKIKLERVENRLKILRRSVKRIENGTLIEKEFVAKELNQMNKKALEQLADLMIRYPETAQTVNQHLQTKGISMPVIHPGKSRSLSLSSVTSGRISTNDEEKRSLNSSKNDGPDVAKDVIDYESSSIKNIIL